MHDYDNNRSVKLHTIAKILQRNKITLGLLKNNIKDKDVSFWLYVVPVISKLMRSTGKPTPERGIIDESTADRRFY